MLKKNLKKFAHLHQHHALTVEGQKNPLVINHQSNYDYPFLLYVAFSGNNVTLWRN